MMQLICQVARLFFGHREVMNLTVGFEPQKGWASSERGALAKNGWEIAYDALAELTLVSVLRDGRFPGQSVSNRERGTVAKSRLADNLTASSGAPHDSAAGCVAVVGET